MQVANSMDKDDNDSSVVVKRLSVPLGLEELMESLTKQVLQKKPRDIYSFASDHFANLLELRDKSSPKNLRDSSNLSTLPKAITLSDSQANILSYKSAIFATAPSRLRFSNKQPKSRQHEVHDKVELDSKIGGGKVQHSQTRQRRMAPTSVPITPPSFGGPTSLLRQQQAATNDHKHKHRQQQQGRKARVTRPAVDGRVQKGQPDETSIQAPVRRSSTERRKQYDKDLHNFRLRRTQIHSSEESISKSDNSDSNHQQKVPNNNRKSRARPSKGATIRQTESFEVLDDNIFIDGNNITLAKNDMSKKIKVKATKVVAGVAAPAVPALILNQVEESKRELDNDQDKSKSTVDDSEMSNVTDKSRKEKIKHDLDIVQERGEDKIDPTLIDNFEAMLANTEKSVEDTKDDVVEIENKMNETLSEGLEVAAAVTNKMNNIEIDVVNDIASNEAIKVIGDITAVNDAIEITTKDLDKLENKFESALSDMEGTADHVKHQIIEHRKKISDEVVKELVSDTANKISNVENTVLDVPLKGIKYIADNVEESIEVIKIDVDKTEKRFEDFMNIEPALEIIEVHAGEVNDDNKTEGTLISSISNDDTIRIDEIDESTNISSDGKFDVGYSTQVNDNEGNSDDIIIIEATRVENTVKSHSPRENPPNLKDISNIPVALLTPDQISPRNEKNESNVSLVTATVVNSAKNIISGSLAAVDEEIAKVLLEYNEMQTTQNFLNKEVENYKSEKSDVEYIYIPLRDYSVENGDNPSIFEERKVQSSEDLLNKNGLSKTAEGIESTEEVIQNSINEINTGDSVKLNEENIQTGIAEVIDVDVEKLEVNNVLTQDTFFGKEVSPRVAHEECLVSKSNRAATQIQSAWRGHRTRKTLARRHGPKTEEYDELPEYRLDAEDILRAAIIIQAFLRGHLVRKALRQSNVSVIDSPEKCHILEEIIEEPEVEIMAENDQRTVKLTDEAVEHALKQLDDVKLGTNSPKLKRSFTIEVKQSVDKQRNKRSASNGSIFDNSDRPDGVAILENKTESVAHAVIIDKPDLPENNLRNDEVIKEVLLSTEAMNEINGTVIKSEEIAFKTGEVIIENGNRNLLSLDSPLKDENALHYELAPTRPLTSENAEPAAVAKLDSDLLKKSLEIVELTTEETCDDLKLQISDLTNIDLIDSNMDASGKDSELSNRSYEEDVSMESQESVNTVIMVKDESERLTPESDVENTLDEIDDSEMDIKESLNEILQGNMGISPLPMDINEKLSRYNDLNIRHDVENSEFIEEMSTVNIDRSELEQNLRNSLEHENNNTIVIQNVNNGNIPEEKNIKILTDIISAATKIQSLYRGYKVRAKTYTKPNGKANIGIIIEGPENNNNAELEDKNKIYDDVIAKIEAEQYEELEKITGNLKDPSTINKQLEETNFTKEEAATMIQKHYKGYRVRRDLTEQANEDIAATSNTGNDKEEKVIDPKEGENEVKQSNTDEEENAALVIQKHYQHFKANRNLTEASKVDDDKSILESKEDDAKSILEPKEDDAKSILEPKEDKIDESTNIVKDVTPVDEEENAALAIQKRYKEFKSKRNILAVESKEDKQVKLEPNKENVYDTKTIMKDDENKAKKNDQEESAALTIQKHYKGYKVRKTSSKTDQEEERDVEHEKKLKLSDSDISDINNKEETGEKEEHEEILKLSDSDISNMNKEIRITKADTAVCNDSMLIDYNDKNKSDNSSIQQFIDSIIETNDPDKPKQHPVIAELKNTETFIETSLPKEDNIFKKRENDIKESTVVIEEIVEDKNDDSKKQIEDVAKPTILQDGKSEQNAVTDKEKVIIHLQDAQIDEVGKENASDETSIAKNVNFVNDFEKMGKQLVNNEVTNISNDLLDENTSKGYKYDSLLIIPVDLSKGASEVSRDDEIDGKDGEADADGIKVIETENIVDGRGKLDRLNTVVEDEVVKEAKYVLGKKDEEIVNSITNDNDLERKVEDEIIIDKNGSNEIILNFASNIDNNVVKIDEMSQVQLTPEIVLHGEVVDLVVKEETRAEDLNIANNIKKPFNIADLHNEILEASLTLSKDEDGNKDKSTDINIQNDERKIELVNVQESLNNKVRDVKQDNKFEYKENLLDNDNNEDMKSKDMETDKAKTSDIVIQEIGEKEVSQNRVTGEFKHTAVGSTNKEDKEESIIEEHAEVKIDKDITKDLQPLENIVQDGIKDEKQIEANKCVNVDLPTDMKNNQNEDCSTTMQIDGTKELNISVTQEENAVNVINEKSFKNEAEEKNKEINATEIVQSLKDAEIQNNDIEKVGVVKESDHSVSTDAKEEEQAALVIQKHYKTFKLHKGLSNTNELNPVVQMEGDISSQVLQDKQIERDVIPATVQDASGKAKVNNDTIDEDTFDDMQPEVTAQVQKLESTPEYHNNESDLVVRKENRSVQESEANPEPANKYNLNDGRLTQEDPKASFVKDLQDMQSDGDKNAIDNEDQMLLDSENMIKTTDNNEVSYGDEHNKVNKDESTTNIEINANAFLENSKIEDKVEEKVLSTTDLVSNIPNTKTSANVLSKCNNEHKEPVQKQNSKSAEVKSHTQSINNEKEKSKEFVHQPESGSNIVDDSKINETLSAYGKSADDGNNKTDLAEEIADATATNDKTKETISLNDKEHSTSTKDCSLEKEITMTTENLVNTSNEESLSIGNVITLSKGMGESIEGSEKVTELAGSAIQNHIECNEKESQIVLVAKEKDLNKDLGEEIKDSKKVSELSESAKEADQNHIECNKNDAQIILIDEENDAVKGNAIKDKSEEDSAMPIADVESKTKNIENDGLLEPSIEKEKTGSALSAKINDETLNNESTEKESEDDVISESLTAKEITDFPLQTSISKNECFPNIEDKKTNDDSKNNIDSEKSKTNKVLAEFEQNVDLGTKQLNNWNSNKHGNKNETFEGKESVDSISSNVEAVRIGVIPGSEEDQNEPEISEIAVVNCEHNDSTVINDNSSTDQVTDDIKVSHLEDTDSNAENEVASKISFDDSFSGSKERNLNQSSDLEEKLSIQESNNQMMTQPIEVNDQKEDTKPALKLEVELKSEPAIIKAKGKLSFDKAEKVEEVNKGDSASIDNFKSIETKALNQTIEATNEPEINNSKENENNLESKSAIADTIKSNKIQDLAVEDNNKPGLDMKENKRNLETETETPDSKEMSAIKELENNIESKDIQKSKVELKPVVEIAEQGDKDTIDLDVNQEINFMDDLNSNSANAEQKDGIIIENSVNISKNLEDEDKDHEIKVELNTKLNSDNKKKFKSVTESSQHSDLSVTEGADNSMMITTDDNKNEATKVVVNDEPEAEVKLNDKTMKSEALGTATFQPLTDEVGSTVRKFSAEQQQTCAQLKSKSEEIESQLRKSLKEIEAFTNEQLQEPFYLHDPIRSGTASANPIARVVQIAAGTTHTSAANIELLQTAAFSRSDGQAIMKVQEASPLKPLRVNVDSSGNIVSPVLGVVNPEDMKDGRLPVTLQLCQEGAAGDAAGPPGQVFVIINALDITNPKQRGNRRRASGKIVDSNRNTVPVVITTTADGAITDLEEKSATKIQAGVRGFLVRRRNQKNTNKN